MIPADIVDRLYELQVRATDGRTEIQVAYSRLSPISPMSANTPVSASVTSIHCVRYRHNDLGEVYIPSDSRLREYVLKEFAAKYIMSLHLRDAALPVLGPVPPFLRGYFRYRSPTPRFNENYDEHFFLVGDGVSFTDREFINLADIQRWNTPATVYLRRVLTHGRYAELERIDNRLQQGQISFDEARFLQLDSSRFDGYRSYERAARLDRMAQYELNDYHDMIRYRRNRTFEEQPPDPTPQFLEVKNVELTEEQTELFASWGYTDVYMMGGRYYGFYGRELTASLVRKHDED